MEDLGSLVARRISDLGMSLRGVQQASARKGFEVSHSTVSKITRGKYPSPGERILRGLSLALDLPMSELRQAAGVDEPGTPFRLPDYASRLSSSERAAVEHMVRVIVEAKDERRVTEHEERSAPIDELAQRRALTDEELLWEAERQPHAASHGEEGIGPSDDPEEGP